MPCLYTRVVCLNSHFVFYCLYLFKIYLVIQCLGVTIRFFKLLFDAKLILSLKFPISLFLLASALFLTVIKTMYTVMMVFIDRREALWMFYNNDKN